MRRHLGTSWWLMYIRDIFAWRLKFKVVHITGFIGIFFILHPITLGCHPSCMIFTNLDWTNRILYWQHWPWFCIFEVIILLFQTGSVWGISLHFHLITFLMFWLLLLEIHQLICLQTFCCVQIVVFYTSFRFAQYQWKK